MVAMSESGSRRTSSSSGRQEGGGGDDVDVVEQLKSLKRRAGDVVENVTSGARETAEQVKHKAAEMTEAITSTLKEEAERLFDEQKGKAASKVGRYGKLIHQSAHALRAVKADGVADMVDGAAERVEHINDYLEERTLAQVLDDVGEVARRHPGMMLGGLFIAGLAGARFLKASASRDDAGGGSASESDEDEGGDEGGDEERQSRGRPSGSRGSRRGG